MEQVIDIIIENMSADEVLGCLGEDGSPIIDNFYSFALMRLENDVANYMNDNESEIAKKINDKWGEIKDEENFIYDTHMDLQRANGWC